MSDIRFENRAELEKYSRANNVIIDHNGKPAYTKMLGEYWIAVNPDDKGLNPHFADGFWESWIQLWVNHNVFMGSRALDLGANVGVYAFQLAAMGCTVDAYEPNPPSFSLLQKGADMNVYPHVNLYNQAVGLEAGEIDFHVPVDNPMNASFYPIGKGYEENIISVDVINELDDYDFIKMDIEGAEIEAFQLLDPKRHPLVLMEFEAARYDNPEEFINQIFATYSWVGYVNTEGQETLFTDHAELLNHIDWSMLVLRG